MNIKITPLLGKPWKCILFCLLENFKGRFGIEPLTGLFRIEGLLKTSNLSFMYKCKTLKKIGNIISWNKIPLTMDRRALADLLWFLN